MSRILNFSKFSKLYEEEMGGQSGNSPKLDTEAQNLLDMIIYLISSCYGSLLGLTSRGEYKNALRDLTSVISAAGDKKGEAFKKIIANVAGSVSKEFKEEGLDKMWVDAGDMAADAYTAMAEQFKDDKDKLEEVSSMVNKRMTKFIEQLKISAEDYKANESENFLSINEGWFTGKRGNVKNLISQGIVVDTLLKQEASNKQLAPDVQKLQSELDAMMAKLAKLSRSRDARKEIEETELDKMAERLTQMPFDLNKKKEQMAKSNKSFSEAASLFVKSQYLASKAYAKENQVKTSISKQAEDKAVEDGKTGKSSGESIPIDLKLESPIAYVKADSGKVNEVVAQVQQLMYDKFKGDKKVADSALFKKFASYFKDDKADGKFGPATAGLVKALKAGFEMTENTTITQKFIDELSKHEMVAESYAAKYLAPFMLLEFDYDAFSKSAGGSGSGAASGAGGGSGAPAQGNKVDDWYWNGETGTDRGKLRVKSSLQAAFKQKDGEKLVYSKPNEFDEDIRNFQRLVLNYVRKLGGEKEAIKKLPDDFDAKANGDNSRFTNFLKSKPDGGFGVNTMAAVRHVRGILKKEGKDNFSYLPQEDNSYTIVYDLAKAMEEAMK